MALVASIENARENLEAHPPMLDNGGKARGLEPLGTSTPQAQM